MDNGSGTSESVDSGLMVDLGGDDWVFLHDLVLDVLDSVIMPDNLTTMQDQPTEYTALVDTMESARPLAQEPLRGAKRQRREMEHEVDESGMGYGMAYDPWRSAHESVATSVKEVLGMVRFEGGGLEEMEKEQSGENAGVVFQTKAVAVSGSARIVIAIEYDANSKIDGDLKQAAALWNNLEQILHNPRNTMQLPWLATETSEGRSANELASIPELASAFAPMGPSMTDGFMANSSRKYALPSQYTNSHKLPMVATSDPHSSPSMANLQFMEPQLNEQAFVTGAASRQQASDAQRDGANVRNPPHPVDAQQPVVEFATPADGSFILPTNPQLSGLATGFSQVPGARSNITTVTAATAQLHIDQPNVQTPLQVALANTNSPYLAHPSELVLQSLFKSESVSASQGEVSYARNNSAPTIDSVRIADLGLYTCYLSKKNPTCASFRSIKEFCFHLSKVHRGRGVFACFSCMEQGKEPPTYCQKSDLNRHLKKWHQITDARILEARCSHSQLRWRRSVFPEGCITHRAGILEALTNASTD